MRFDPNLIPPDEPPLDADGELKLPDDFAALADQLHADATHLAAQYPARPGQPREQPARSTRQKQLATVAAVTGSTLAILLLAVAVFGQHSAPTADQPTPPAYLSTSLPQTTTVSLTELSAPELEGVLDLIERQRETISVSF